MRGVVPRIVSRAGTSGCGWCLLGSTSALRNAPSPTLLILWRVYRPAWTATKLANSVLDLDLATAPDVPQTLK